MRPFLVFKMQLRSTEGNVMVLDNLAQDLNWDRCTECGECLVNCRYIDISIEEAVQEIGKINTGAVE